MWKPAGKCKKSVENYWMKEEKSNVNHGNFITPLLHFYGATLADILCKQSGGAFSYDD